MAELFLSYAHQDIGRAQTLAQLLEANGLTVCWKKRRASLCCGLEFLLSLIGCEAKLQQHKNWES